MHERRHVEQLDRRGGRHELVRVARPAQEHEDRAQALAARRQRAVRVRGELGAVARAHLGEPRLRPLEQPRQLGAARRQHRSELSLRGVHGARVPEWMAMIPPAVRIQRTSVRPAAAMLDASASGAGEAPHAAREVRVGVGVPGQAAEQRHHAVEPGPEEPRQRRSLRGRDLEHDDPPAGLRHARHLAQAAVEVGEVARAEAHRHRVEGRRRRSGDRARRPPRTRSREPSREPARASPARSPSRSRTRRATRARARGRRCRSRRRARASPGPTPARSALRRRQAWCMPAVISVLRGS